MMSNYLDARNTCQQKKIIIKKMNKKSCLRLKDPNISADSIKSMAVT